MAADNNLPQEVIIEEILTRLPVKSLVRYRCVCKLWNSLSYNPDFVSRFNYLSCFVSQNPNREIHNDDDDDYIVCMNDYDKTEDSTPHYGPSILSRKKFTETRMDFNKKFYLFNLDYMHLVGSVNGLVCMAFYGYNKCDYQFIVWNPTISLFKQILVPEHLGLNSRQISYLYGFGWESVTNDYKLIIAKITTIVSPAAVYSCKADCWSWSKDMSIPHSYKPLNKDRQPPCVIVNGSPYWRTYLYTYSYNNSDIAKFDFRNNDFTYLNVPSHIHFYSLININDCLGLIEFELEYATDVYRFDEEGSIWTKMYTVHKNVNIYTKHLCFKYGGEIVFGKSKKLYDPKSHATKRRPHGSCAYCLVKSHNNKIKCCDCGGGSLVNGFSYTPSLVTLPGMKALHRRHGKRPRAE